MRRFGASMLCACLAGALVHAREYPPLSDEEKAHVGQLLKDMGSEEFKVRDKAELTLRDLGEGFMDYLASIQGDVKDPEAEVRLQRVLAPWSKPYERQFEIKEGRVAVSRDSVPGLVERIYERYVQEIEHIQRFSGDYVRLGYFGTAPNRRREIENDFRMLVRCFPREALDGLGSLTTSKLKGRDHTFNVSLGTLIRSVASASTPPSDEVMAALDRLSVRLEGEEAPKDDDWKKLKEEFNIVSCYLRGKSERETLKERIHDVCVSMIFNEAKLTDVLKEICVQADIRITFEPHELFEEAKSMRSTFRLEGVPAMDAMREILKLHSLEFRLHDTVRRQRVIVFRADDP